MKQAKQKGRKPSPICFDDEDSRPLMIAKPSSALGLDFWNNETGFGRLADATVFTPEEAANYDLPIAFEEPEWLTLPRGLT